MSTGENPFGGGGSGGGASRLSEYAPPGLYLLRLPAMPGRVLSAFKTDKGEDQWQLVWDWELFALPTEPDGKATPVLDEDGDAQTVRQWTGTHPVMRIGSDGPSACRANIEALLKRDLIAAGLDTGDRYGVDYDGVFLALGALIDGKRAVVYANIYHAEGVARQDGTKPLWVRVGDVAPHTKEGAAWLRQRQQVSARPPMPASPTPSPEERIAAASDYGAEDEGGEPLPF